MAEHEASCSSEAFQNDFLAHRPLNIYNSSRSNKKQFTAC